MTLACKGAGITRETAYVHKKAMPDFVATWEDAKEAAIEILEAEARAVDMQDAPGRKTGVLVREYKGHSDLPVYKLDAALLKKMRDLEREIAIEKGEWTEKRELTGAGGEPLLDPLVAALEKAYGWSIEV